MLMFVFLIKTEKVLPLLAANLRPDFVSVCNNATWAIGEISVKYKEKMKPYVAVLLPALIVNINTSDIPKTLMENTGEYT